MLGNKVFQLHLKPITVCSNGSANVESRFFFEKIYGI